MFEQTFTNGSKTKRERSIALALAVQTLGVLGLLALPLINIGTIEAGKRFLLQPPAPLKPDVPLIKSVAERTSSTSPVRVAHLETIAHPRAYALRVEPLLPGDAPTLLGTAEVASGGGGGIPFGLGEAAVVVPPPRPQAPPKPASKPIRVSSTLSEARLVYGPKPTYPRMALQARIEGTVRIQATISRDGRIENLHVLSGHPLLDGPALEVVRTWRYRPLLLNGDPVEVITEIDVNFTLRQ